MNIAYNVLTGGQSLEDLELLRNDEGYLDALGAQTIPDPTTAGDFCRRFGDPENVEALMDAIHEARLRIWRQQPKAFFSEAFLDADGSLAPTYGECKEGMDISYKGIWGYHPLVISLANTKEPLCLVNRSGNRPSAEGAAPRFDQMIALCRKAGFRRITLRGDTDFSQSEHLDRWDEDRVQFIFGFDATEKLREIASQMPKSAWRTLERPEKYQVQTSPRAKPERVKQEIVLERKFSDVRLIEEWVGEFDYQPVKCKKTHRVVVVRKHLRTLKGQTRLFDEMEYFFYITNKRKLSAEEVVLLANDRCDQENLIEQLKNGVHALRMPVNTLVANWAYMVMASLAWTLKAWFALCLPEIGRWEKNRRAEKQSVLRMEFRKFLNYFIRIPAQVVRTGRRIILRLLAWNPYVKLFLRGVEVLERPLRC